MPILEIMIDENDVNSNIIEYYKNLENKSSSDSGVDLIAPEKINVNANDIGTINFKIKCQMKNNDSLIPYYLFPRSSISKTPLIMANSVGIIDSGYRGNIMAKVRNIPLNYSLETYVIEEGTRLFQICSPDLSPLKVKLVDTLISSERGEGGFGSTGATY